MSKKNKDSQKYSQMLNRVEELIKDISTSEIDLDEMVEKVEEGYDLIQKMREKLTSTRERIEDLHKKYESATED